MSVDLIKKHLKCGFYHEARCLLEQQQDVLNLMQNDLPSALKQNDQQQLPLLIMCTLIRDEDCATNLSRILLEKGYLLSMSDANGLCALHYAIALRRIKLVELFLASFNCELDVIHDCYGNTFLHYAFASGCESIVQRFRDTYAKFYAWQPSQFDKMRNRDGLSVRHLMCYFTLYNDFLRQQKKKQRPKTGYMAHSVASTSKQLTIDTEYQVMKEPSFQMPACFYLDSNPIVICKYIKRVYTSKSTLKSDLLFLDNSSSFRQMSPPSQQNKPLLELRQQDPAKKKYKEFKRNILYQIKSLNRIDPDKISKSKKQIQQRAKSSYAALSSSSASFVEKKPAEAQKQLFITETTTTTATNDFSSQSSCWKSDFLSIIGDYSLIWSPSYRIGTTTILKQQQQNAAAAAAATAAAEKHHHQETSRAVAEPAAVDTTTTPVTSAHHQHHQKPVIKHDKHDKHLQKDHHHKNSAGKRLDAQHHKSSSKIVAHDKD